jgi:recombination protein RecA
VAAYIDAEHALDTEYARKLGVDVENLLISQPDTGEQALEICDILVRSGAVDVVVIDSVAALVPKAEIEGDMGDSHVGLQARLMSQALRKLTGAIARSNTSVIFINQLREKIGVMFGNPETTTGGKALKFYASGAPRHPPHRPGEGQGGRGGLARPREGGEEQGRRAVQAGRVRHHVRRGDQPRLAGARHRRRGGIIEKSGAWYSYKTQRIGQGRENAKMFLKDNPALMAEVEEQVKGVLGIGAGVVDAGPSED